MIRRVCPECGASWYSADTKPWLCDGCGMELRSEHERPLKIEGKDEETCVRS